MSLSNDINASIDNGDFSVSQIIVVTVAVLLYMLDGLDIAAMSFTAHRISETMTLPPEQLGVVFSSALAGMMLGAMFLAPMSDAVGRRVIILISVAVIGISMFFTALAHTFWHLVLTRAITGLGIGAMLASLTAITAEFSPKKYRGMSVVVVVAGYPLGATLGGIVAAPLMTMYGWESVFLLGGSISMFMLVIVYYLMPESIQFMLIRRPSNALEKINRTLFRIRKPRVEELPELNLSVKVKQANVFGLLGRQHRKNTLLLWSSAFLCLMSLYFLLSWIPRLIIISGFSEEYGIYASVAFTAGGVIGTVILGILTSRIGLTNVISVFLLSSASFLCVYAYYPDHLSLLYCLATIGFLFTSGYSGLYAVAARVYPTEIRATGVGWAVGVSRLGAVIGPYIGGMLVANKVSMEANFVIIAVPIFLAGLLVWCLRIQ